MKPTPLDRQETLVLTANLLISQLILLAIGVAFSKNDKCYIGPKYKEKLLEVLNDGYFTNNLDSYDYAKRIIS